MKSYWERAWNLARARSWAGRPGTLASCRHVLEHLAQRLVVLGGGLLAVGRRRLLALLQAPLDAAALRIDDLLRAAS